MASPLGMIDSRGITENSPFGRNRLEKEVKKSGVKNFNGVDYFALFSCPKSFIK